MSTFIIHVGTFKTATTTLQNIIFPRITNMLYLGKTLKIKEHLKKHNTRLDAIQIESLSSEELIYFYSLLLTQLTRLYQQKQNSGKTSLSNFPWKLFENALDRIEQQFPEKTLLYSNEGLLHHNHHAFPNTSDHSLFNPPIAHHQKIFPRNKKILVCLRDPDEYLFSRYLQLQYRRYCANVQPLNPTQFLFLQEYNYRIAPASSCFQFTLQHSFIEYLKKITACPISMIHYNSPHFTSSISQTLKNSIHAEFHDNEDIDMQMKKYQLNSAKDERKTNAIDATLFHEKVCSLEELKNKFYQILTSLPIYSSILREKIF